MIDTRKLLADALLDLAASIEKMDEMKLQSILRGQWTEVFDVPIPFDLNGSDYDPIGIKLFMKTLPVYGVRSRGNQEERVPIVRERPYGWAQDMLSGKGVITKEQEEAKITWQEEKALYDRLLAEGLL